ncbi:hypothetical protein C474_08357 [Halogeometricum pallidum JCM 14848]|uniref:Uncharacterized protein n=1 Tax=Halogeometricum pallidum JCM 14848 TaxID=1227487 RepID=M0D8Z9_HALPD|nr:hypothetical protein [Halogeometricum pallidum]ELZ31303.1 hypothetical protein C474_08357 [Halogeometricum pallidum JCM 14848]
MVLDSDLESTVASADDVPEASAVHDIGSEIPIEDVFDEAFMAEYTEFDSFEEMVAASPSKASSPAELDQVPTGAWDEFIAETTAFADDEEMVLAARDHWVAKKLDL